MATALMVLTEVGYGAKGRIPVRDNKDSTQRQLASVTITLTDVERQMLEDLMRWRHPTDGHVISMTIRECIRETWRRAADEHEASSPGHDRQRQ